MGFTFSIGDVEVFFPYDTVYPEQLDYMIELKHTLDAKGHCILEMPTGTGKTVALFALITSYQFFHPEVGKLVYCTRTVPEMSKALEELRNVIEYRVEVLAGRRVAQSLAETEAVTGDILAVGLSARRNMCIHPEVSREADRERIDEKCRELTASFVRSHANVDSRKTCEYYTRYQDFAAGVGRGCALPNGVYTVEDLAALGAQEKNKWCPYFMSKRLLQTASVVVLNYQYVLDPKVSQVTMLGGADIPVRNPEGSRIDEVVPGAMKEPSIVVFDEAHNIDDVCIEALSVRLDSTSLERSSKNLTDLAAKVEQTKQIDAARLQEEYQRLVQGLQDAGEIDDQVAERISSPVLPDDIVVEAIPGNIRRAEHFINLMRRVVLFLKSYLKERREARTEGALSLQHRMEEEAQVDSRTLKFCYDRLRSLLNTLEVVNVDEFGPITRVADFCTLLGHYVKGFIAIVDPYPEAHGIYDPVFDFSCLDAAIAMRPVMKRFQSVILTSGTISPLEMYPKMLAMTNVVSTHSFQIQLDRRCICPMIVSRGSDQVPVSSRFALRDDPSVVRNYGQLLEDLVATVPDGMVCFFPSYAYMEKVIKKWYETGVLARVMAKKLVFIETKDIVATTYALANFRLACDCGRGAVFFSVARGKVSEGIDFDRHYGRCVVLFGVPFQYTLSKVLRARLEFLKEHHKIQESEFLTFDAMRAASQCVGRVIRSKRDYGIMVFADQRYSKQDKRDKIPEWIQTFMDIAATNMSADGAIQGAREFLLQMSQPQIIDSTTCKSLLSPDVARQRAADKSKASAVHGFIQEEDRPGKRARIV
mmetsp:Transcript_25104/g.64132  ORF Transcript_25104/g.64132 Transcript_25104/m.64132 type:complete len:817 (-) Transcript_25104:40-2490(-)